MDDVLSTYGFPNLGDFLAVLFQPRIPGEKDLRTKCHRAAVSAFLQGTSTIKMCDIIELLYNHPQSRPKQKYPEQRAAAFSPSIPLKDIRFARPCLAAWATRLVGNSVYYRVGKLARKKRNDVRSRRHLRASTNGRKENAEVLEWEDTEFTIQGLADEYRNEDEVIWYLTESMTASRKNGVVVMRARRPHPVVLCYSLVVEYFLFR